MLKHSISIIITLSSLLVPPHPVMTAKRHTSHRIAEQNRELQSREADDYQQNASNKPAQDKEPEKKRAAACPPIPSV